MTDLYSYKPLPETPTSIRLLILYPSLNKADPIHCNIQQVSFSSDPIYDALSYTWDLDESLDASDPASYSIFLEFYPFKVTPNLYFALQQLRTNINQPRTLWIDAICINQSDDIEKGKQVQAMSTIYSLAQEVIIWLGREEKYDSNAFTLVERLQREFPILQSCDQKSIWDFKVRSIQEDNHSWEGLGAVLRRRWFTRVWVLQEVVMARKAVVMCGPLSISWDTLANVISVIGKLGMSNEFREVRDGRVGAPIGAFLVKVQQLKAMLASGVNLDLLNLVGMARTLDATDLRDKIFSVLAFATDSELTPDYSLSIDELLRTINVSLVTPLTDFRFLSFFDARSIENPCKLTPWGPNYVDVEFDREAFATWSAIIEGSVAGSLKPQAVASEDGSQVAIRGIIFDQIEHRSCKYSRFQSDYSATSASDPAATFKRLKRTIAHAGTYLASCQRVAKNSRPTTHPRHGTHEAFWRTLMCNLDMQGRIPTTSHFLAYQAFAQQIFLVDSMRKLDDNIQAQLGFLEILGTKGQEGSPFEGPMIRAAAGRVFCTTKEGYMGMVPAKSKKGDRVCAFLGAHTMFVIRPKKKGLGSLEGRIYQMIGECYIHGTTDEEILKLDGFERRVVDITLG